MTRADETSGDWTSAAPEVRLAAGDTALVGLGPLCVGDLCWYEVFNNDPLVGWDADHDGQPDDGGLGRGWVAAGDAEGSYLTRSTGSLAGLFAASGRASAAAVSYSVDQSGLGASVRWAMATDGLAPCTMVVTLQPGDRVLLSESLTGAFQEGSTLTYMLEPGSYELGVSASVPDAPDAACPWALVVQEVLPGYVP